MPTDGIYPIDPEYIRAKKVSDSLMPIKLNNQEEWEVSHARASVRESNGTIHVIIGERLLAIIDRLTLAK